MRSALVAALSAGLMGCSPPSAPPEPPIVEPVSSEARAPAPTAPPASASVAVSATVAPPTTGFATPTDAVLPEEPTPAQLEAALAGAIVKKGGTTTKRGSKIGSDCVKPGAHANAINGHLGDDWPGQASIDLDGDGTNDQVLSSATGMTVTYDLYVMRDTCGHPVGHVAISGGLRGTERFVGGMRVLEARSGCPVDCCPSFTNYELVWNGSRYAVVTRAGKRDCSKTGF